MSKAERIVDMIGELITSASITGAVEKVQAILDEPDLKEMLKTEVTFGQKPDEVVTAEAFYELDMTVCNILTRLDKLESTADAQIKAVNEQYAQIKRLESNQNNRIEHDKSMEKVWLDILGENVD